MTLVDHTNPYVNIDTMTVSEAIRQLRTMISEEYAASNLYEQFADTLADDQIFGQLYEAIYDIANEERVHAGEFEAMIEYLQDMYDFKPTDDELMDEGEDETEELFGDDEHNEMPVEQDVLQPTDDRVVDEGY